MKLKQASISVDSSATGSNSTFSNTASSVKTTAKKEDSVVSRGTAAMSEISLKSFHHRIVDELSGAYCDCHTFEKLLRHGEEILGGDRKRIINIVTLELQRLNVVDEYALLKELESLLDTITQAEKKLGKKERTDALQSVCKARFGLSKGLDLEVAERFIISYCRSNLIKERQGLWGWKVL